MTHMHCSCMSINSHLLVTVQEAWRREWKGGEKRDKLNPNAAAELTRPGLDDCSPASHCEYVPAKRRALWGKRSNKLGIGRAAAEASACGVNC